MVTIFMHFSLIKILYNFLNDVVASIPNFGLNFN